MNWLEQAREKGLIVNEGKPVILTGVLSTNDSVEVRMTKKRTKYAAVKTVVDGITFASKKEAKRYQELKMRESVCLIRDLKLQPKFPIIVKGKKVCDYFADFGYWDVDKGDFVVEDVKGMKTPVYRLKKKLVEALYGIKITEA